MISAVPAGRENPSPVAVLVDANAIGEQLGVPASWVLAEARADRIPHVRLGRYVRFDPSAVEDWWRARVRGPWRAGGAAARVASMGKPKKQPTSRDSLRTAA